MRIDIVGTELPGRDCSAAGNLPAYSDIHVGVQFKSPRTELLGVTAADAEAVTWSLKCSVDGNDVKGPQIQGRPGDRFIYLSWRGVDDAGRFTMFRRAKLMLVAVPGVILAAAAASGTLVGALGLTDAQGQPLCARVVPPRIHWSSR